MYDIVYRLSKPTVFLKSTDCLKSLFKVEQLLKSTENGAWVIALPNFVAIGIVRTSGDLIVIKSGLAVLGSSTNRVLLPLMARYTLLLCNWPF